MEYLGYAMLAFVAVIFAYCVHGLGLKRAAIVIVTSLAVSTFTGIAVLLSVGAA